MIDSSHGSDPRGQRDPEDRNRPFGDCRGSVPVGLGVLLAAAVLFGCSDSKPDQDRESNLQPKSVSADLDATRPEQTTDTGPPTETDNVVDVFDYTAIVSSRPDRASIEKVRERNSKSDKSVLQPNESSLTAEQYRDQMRSWYRSVYVQAYQQIGRCDPEWDAAAIEFLRANIEQLVAAEEGSVADSTLLAQAKAVVAAGCTDPLVLFLYGRLASRIESDRSTETLPRSANTASFSSEASTTATIPDKKSDGSEHPSERAEVSATVDGSPASHRHQEKRMSPTQALRAAVHAFAESGYAASVKYEATVLYLSLLQQAPGIEQRQIDSLRQRVFDEIAAAITVREYASVERRVLLARIDDAMEGVLSEHRKSLVNHVASRSDTDPWLLRMLTARTDYALAWQARGSGAASSVNEQGRNIFRAHMRRARGVLVEAWDLHAQYPEAATDLIAVTMAVNGVAGETPRFWFDRAVEIQFDYYPAYNKLLWSMRPRWGGSHDAMLEFGRECLATKRFDTQVPRQFDRAVRDIASELRNRAQIYSRPDVFEDYQALFAGEATADSAQQDLNDSRLIAIAFLSGRYDDAKTLLERLGKHAVAKAFLEFNLTLNHTKRALFPVPQVAARFTGHTGPILSLSFGRDDRMLLSSGQDQSARLWNAETGFEEWMCSEHTGTVGAAAISADGRLLVTASCDSTARLWDLATKESRATLQHDGHVHAMALSRDGSLLATAGPFAEGADEIWLWDLTDGSLRSRLKGHTDAINSLVFVSPSTLVSAAGRDIRNYEDVKGEVIVWDLVTAVSKQELRPFKSGALKAAVSSDGRLICIAGQEAGKDKEVQSLVRILDSETGEVLQTLPNQSGRITDLCLTYDGRTLITSSTDRTIHLWDIQSATGFGTLRGHNAAVTSLALASSGVQMVSADALGQVKTWDLQQLPTRSRVQASLVRFAFASGVVHLQSVEAGRFLATCSASEGVMLWESETGFTQGRCCGLDPSAAPAAFTMASDGKEAAVLATLIAEDAGAAIIIQDMLTGEVLSRIEAQQSPYRAISLSADGKMLAAGNAAGELHIWEMVSGRSSVPHSQRAHADRVSALALNADGTQLASAAADGSLSVWDVRQGISDDKPSLQSRIRLNSGGARVDRLQFSPNGQYLLVSTKDQVQCWHPAGQRMRFAVPGREIAFSHDGRYFATAGGSQLLTETRIWDSASGKQIVQLSGSHSRPVTAVCFSADDSRVITASADRSVKIWDVATSEEVLDVSAAGD